MPNVSSAPWKYSTTGEGDVKALKGALKGRSLDQPSTVVVSDIDNLGQAY